MSASAASAADRLDDLKWRGLSVGFLFLLISVLWGIGRPAQFFQSYLLAYIFYCGIALGCLAILMMSHLTGGAWGLVPRRIIEAAAKTTPLLLFLFVPIAAGVHWLYPFSHPAEVAQNAVLAHRQHYLNLRFFLVRSGICFALWIALAFVLGTWSQRQDQATAEQRERLSRWMRMLSGPGLFVLGVSVSFAYIDWIMALQVEWRSSIFGMLIVSGQALSAYAFVIIMAVALFRQPPLRQALSADVLHDLANLMQAFVLIWAYMAFSQFLISWAGNLPAEIIWYTYRVQTSWRWLGILLIAGHFALPFFLLLFRTLKRHRHTLLWLAAWVLAMRLIDAYWLVEPDFHRQGFSLHLLDFLAPIGLGGLWLACCCWLLQRAPLLLPGVSEQPKAEADQANRGGTES